MMELHFVMQPLNAAYSRFMVQKHPSTKDSGCWRWGATPVLMNLLQAPRCRIPKTRAEATLGRLAGGATTTGASDEKRQQAVVLSS
jgi:hypothetical protein